MHQVGVLCPYRFFNPCWAETHGGIHILALLAQPVSRMHMRLLATYAPSEAERQDPQLFADGVQFKMAQELGLAPLIIDVHDSPVPKPPIKRRRPRPPPVRVQRGTRAAVRSDPPALPATQPFWAVDKNGRQLQWVSPKPLVEVAEGSVGLMLAEAPARLRAIDEGTGLAPGPKVRPGYGSVTPQGTEEDVKPPASPGPYMPRCASASPSVSVPRPTGATPIAVGALG